MLPKISIYKRHFHGTKKMFFLIKNDELLEKYKKIRNKVKKVSKEDLITNQSTMKNISKLRENLKYINIS